MDPEKRMSEGTYQGARLCSTVHPCTVSPPAQQSSPLHIRGGVLSTPSFRRPLPALCGVHSYNPSTPGVETEDILKVGASPIDRVSSGMARQGCVTTLSPKQTQGKPSQSSSDAPFPSECLLLKHQAWSTRTWVFL